MLVFLSAFLYILGFMFRLQHKTYGNIMEKAGEISLCISLIIFFIIPAKK